MKKYIGCAVEVSDYDLCYIVAKRESLTVSALTRQLISDGLRRYCQNQRLEFTASLSPAPLLRFSRKRKQA